MGYRVVYFLHERHITNSNQYWEYLNKLKQYVSPKNIPEFFYIVQNARDIVKDIRWYTPYTFWSF